MQSEPHRAGEKKSLALALQGGGAHGALTLGVLDPLAAGPSLDVQAISGTRGGAINAAVFADGLARNGAARAQRALRGFWPGPQPIGSMWAGALSQIRALRLAHNALLALRPAKEVGVPMQLSQRAEGGV